MINKDKLILLRQAEKLYKLGMVVDSLRNELKVLVERDVPFDDPQMLRTLAIFEKSEVRWKRLEVRHLKLRKKLGI